MATSTKSRLTGERPQQGVTPDSLLALHEAGYRAVLERMGGGRILDVGCGQGFESARFLDPTRQVVGADYSSDAVATAAGRYGPEGLRVAQCDARRLSLGTGSFDWVCSSHLIEHFPDAEAHADELARVLAPGGKAFVITPNAPADFENPFHIRLFRRDELVKVLERSFDDVWVGGIDAVPAVKENFRLRREKAAKVLRLDVFDLTGHPTASRAYAWSSPMEGSDKRRFFAVLHHGPVVGPLEAVQVAIVAEHKARR